MTEQELRNNLDALRKQIIELKATLTKVHTEKEKHYTEKQDVRKKILSLIQEMKTSKQKRDELTSTVKVSKEKRHELSEEIKQKIEEVKKLKTERDAVLKKQKITFSPSQLRSEISHLEKKIETEVIPFEKEKQLMKLIKEKKKQLASVKDVSSFDERSHTLSKEIDVLKKQADLQHEELQHKADQSQQKHEMLLTTSKSIDELRTKEAECQKLYDEAKKRFGDVRQDYLQKVEEAKTISQQLGEVYKENDRRRKESVEKILAEKEQEVEEKIKKRQKLTTEDLLLFQKMNK